MRVLRSAFPAVVALLATVVPLAAQQPATPPVETGLEEKVQVTLVQIDAVVMDKEGKTASGLTKDNFTMAIGGREVKIDTVDFVCPIGPTADPAPMKKSDTAPPILGPGVKRRIVFAFDYSFLHHTQRSPALDAAEGMLRMSKAPEEEVMIVALTSEVRVEQKFTSDIRQLAASLSRMKHDVTLWAREYPVGTTGRSYFRNISTLMDVLGSYDGAKAVVYFSQADVVGAAMRDLYYNDVAAHAAASRAAIYPASPDFFDTTRGPGDTLVRLANSTGGRMQFFGNDISIPYRRAQRDILCRYTLGAYTDPKETREPQTLSVNLKNTTDLQIRAPEQVQYLTEEARAAARAGAAYVDPGPFERPLVRSYGLSAVPAGADSWDTLLAVSFPAPVGPTGADIDVKAVVRQDNRAVGEYKRTIHVDPASGGATSKPVTILGNSKLKSGQYDLNVVLTDKSGELVAAETSFIVPLVIPDALMLRGPVLGKVVPGGQFLRANPKDRPEDTRLGKLLGPGNGFEPLFVEEIDKGDKLFFYWSACVYQKNLLPSQVVVTRTLFDSKGELARTLDPVPLQLDSRGKDVSCLDKLETLEADTLASGDYRLDVTVVHPNGDVISRGTEPLHVR